MSVAAIILAAGRGTRFGEEPKLLARLGGKPLVRHVAEAASGSSLSPIIAVTGHRAEEVEAAIADLPLRVVRNPLYAEGLSTSLKAGFAALPGDAEAAAILLADMPRVSASLLDALAPAWREGGRSAALVPTFEGRRGNPVILSAALGQEVLALEGDVGAGLLLRRRSDVLLHPVPDRAVLQDVDTTDALESLVSGTRPGQDGPG